MSSAISIRTKPTTKPINISFKNAEPADLNALYLLDKASDSAHHWRQSCFTQDKTLLAMSGAQIIGFVVYQSLFELEILRLSVAQNFKKQGVASALIQHLKHQNLPLFLEVRISNTPALNLYQQLGFCEVGARKKYYSNGETAKILRFSNSSEPI